jgi:hypothetical protein
MTNRTAAFLVFSLVGLILRTRWRADCCPWAHQRWDHRPWSGRCRSRDQLAFYSDEIPQFESASGFAVQMSFNSGNERYRGYYSGSQTFTAMSALEIARRTRSMRRGTRSFSSGLSLSPGRLVEFSAFGSDGARWHQHPHIHDFRRRLCADGALAAHGGWVERRSVWAHPRAPLHGKSSRHLYSRLPALRYLHRS